MEVLESGGAEGGPEWSACSVPQTCRLFDLPSSRLKTVRKLI